jgi:hypothetical protein
MDDQPKRKPGRPRVAEHQQGCAVSTWLRPSEYDQIIQKAKAYDVSVSKLVRVWLRQQLK